MTDRRHRTLGAASTVAYGGFWATLIFGGPDWLLVVLLIAGLPSVIGPLARRRRDPLLDDDMRIPAWLEYAPIGRLAVVTVVGASVAGLCAAFGAGWWSLVAGVAAVALLWVAVRDPMPDPFDRPGRTDR